MIPFGGSCVPKRGTDDPLWGSCVPKRGRDDPLWVSCAPKRGTDDPLWGSCVPKRERTMMTMKKKMIPFGDPAFPRGELTMIVFEALPQTVVVVVGVKNSVVVQKMITMKGEEVEDALLAYLKLNLRLNCIEDSICVITDWENSSGYAFCKSF